MDSNIPGGRVKEAYPVHQFSHILGLDVASVVKEVGENITYLFRVLQSHYSPSCEI